MKKLKLDPRDWIDALIDPDSFLPLVPSTGAEGGFGPEVIAGFATVKGKRIALYAYDVAVKAAAVTPAGSVKIQRLMDKALESGVPVVAFLASPGVSVEHGVLGGDEYAKVLMKNVELSGQIPQFAMVMSVAIGGPAYSATLMDFVLFNRLRSHLMVSSPGVIQKVLGETATLGQLGGWEVHAKKTGLAHFVDETMELQISRLKWLLDFLPSHYQEDPPQGPPLGPRHPLPEIPFDPRVGFDIRPYISGLVDASEWVEYGAPYGPATVTAFARLGGHAVGLIACQSQHLAGSLDCDASHKAARFTRLCDAYNVPIVTLIDSPGFMPGIHEEQKGILRSGAELCRAMLTRVPKLSVVLRKCYGAAAIVLSQTRGWRGDLVLALESSRSAVMGFDAAKEIIYAERMKTESEDDLRRSYFDDFENPIHSYRLGLIDEIIKPDEVRSRLISHLDLLVHQREKKTTPVRGIEP